MEMGVNNKESGVWDEEGRVQCGERWDDEGHTVSLSPELRVVIHVAAPGDRGRHN